MIGKKLFLLSKLLLLSLALSAQVYAPRQLNLGMAYPLNKFPANTYRWCVQHIDPHAILYDKKKWLKQPNNIFYALSLSAKKYRGLLQSNFDQFIIKRFNVAAIPRLFKTLPFLSLTLALLMLATVVITNSVTQKKLRTKLAVYQRQLEQAKERQRISRMMHDDIDAGLAQITQISESIGHSESHKQKEMTEIADASRKLAGSISEIVWSMSVTDNTLNDLLSHLFESLHKQLTQSGIPFHIFLPPEDTHGINLTTDQRRNILLSVKEMVHNAIKYSCASEIIIKGVMMRQGVQFFVSDNGKGFNVTEPTNGKGIKNIQKMINELNGRLTLVSETDGGTHYTFFIPLNIS